MSREQRIVHFSGDVQGVGFRYMATRTARNYDVTGYVRNMPDGRVECVVEGEPEEIKAFLDDLCGRMGRHIRDVGRQTAPASGKYDGFGVKY